MELPYWCFEGLDDFITRLALFIMMVFKRNESTSVLKC